MWAAFMTAPTGRTGEDGQDCLVHRLDLAGLHDVAREERYDEQDYQYRECP